MICIALKHPGGFKQAKGVFQLWSITGLLHQWCAGYLSGHRSLYCIDISARPLQTNWSSECVCLGLLQIYKYIAKSLFILLLNCPVLCSRMCARCVYLLLYLLRLSTQTAPSLLCKLAELDVLPCPPLQAARGQGQGQPLLISSRPGHLFCTGGGDRNQCSKLPLLVRRNQYLAIKPGEACLGITAWMRGFQYCHRRWNKRKTFWIYSLCIEAFYYSSVSKYKLREWFVSNKLIKY